MANAGIIHQAPQTSYIAWTNKTVVIFWEDAQEEDLVHTEIKKIENRTRGKKKGKNEGNGLMKKEPFFREREARLSELTNKSMQIESSVKAAKEKSFILKNWYAKHVSACHAWQATSFAFCSTLDSTPPEEKSSMSYCGI